MRLGHWNNSGVHTLDSVTAISVELRQGSRYSLRQGSGKV